MDSIIITSPSLISEQNIGGISVLTKLTSLYNKEKHYVHFYTGRKDGEKKSFFWILKQFLLPLKYIIFLVLNRQVKMCHINIPQDNKGIIRESTIFFLSKLFHKKIVVHLRGGEFNMKVVPNIFVRYLLRITLVGSNSIICLGKEEKLFINKNYNISETKIYVLENAVEIKDLILHKNYSDVLTLIFLGRIDENKGFQEIINALKDINNKIEIRFLLCGTGPYENNVISELSKILGDKFEYHGIVSGKVKDDLLRKSHIFILPSYFEGLPNALLEAMSFGTVPICTNVGSIPHVIEDKKNGFLIPVRNSSLIIDIVGQLNSDRDYLKKMGLSSHKLIVERYSIHNYVEKLNKIYEITYLK